MNGTTEVVVIGGGYAGAMAASRLTRREDVTVTLVNPRPHFVDRIRLHQLVGGTHDAVADFEKVLAGRVRLVVDTVTRIDTAGRRLALASGDTLGYDHVVYAVGSGGADPDVPGAAEFAHPIATLEDARGVRSVLDAAPATAGVTVVGAGPTGIEAAAELAERGRAVTLVCGGVFGPGLHPRSRRAVAGRLDALGVTVLAGPGARVTAVTRDSVRLDDDRVLPSDVTVWTAGFGVPDLAARSGLSTDALGRLRTDETLTSVDDPRVVAAGDSAAPSDLPYRMSCQAAVQLGPQAAETVLGHIAGERPAPVTAGFNGLCLSLGRRTGLFQATRRNDAPTRFSVGGRPGGRVKEIICRGILWQLTQEARKPGARSWWTRDGEREALLREGHGAAPTAR
ncbi:NAD(P)/FAD-dependent oxidoreductase [Nocardiopsis aegyptia]|uniref:NADH dehydrogenase FAD-containing subunit n=1 Tax=Nocardiopsis aegyptia TaxID=220378 RepID=A0A7Z0EIV8_9ACTN|nr:FAD-dependent oxidoreductase [Nocardiopsis aegyptia]NYJ32888.1 NADH dehydrogenase FAD-containing subunit [Nocardiopsis aegyptia]